MLGHRRWPCPTAASVILGQAEPHRSPPTVSRSMAALRIGDRSVGSPTHVVPVRSRWLAISRPYRLGRDPSTTRLPCSLGSHGGRRAVVSERATAITDELTACNRHIARSSRAPLTAVAAESHSGNGGVPPTSTSTTTCTTGVSPRYPEHQLYTERHSGAWRTDTSPETFVTTDVE